jgi:transposase
MRKVKEVLRLKFDLGLENRQIARSCSIPHSSVANYLSRARAAGISWPLPGDLDEVALEKKLFPPAAVAADGDKATPDFQHIYEELRRHKHVTLQLLWEEYKQAHPEGYQYSRYCELFHRWVSELDVVLRQDYRGGEKLFVDHAGPTIPIINAKTGEIQQVPIFVAVLGASKYTYAEATWRRDLPCWIESHVRTLEFLQGVPAITIPDNWKTGVKNPCYYDPELNPTYRDFAEHYGTVIIPARVRKPRDKAVVENGVLVVERWILAALRHEKFFSLAALNEAIGRLLVKLNNRKFRKLDTTRAQLFAELDKPALKSLPAERFTYAEWKKARVHPDYHVEIARHYYSVPYRYVHQQVDVRTSSQTVEIFLKGQRLATHIRSYVVGGHTTLAEHRPKKHQDIERSTSRILEQGRAIGPSTVAALENIMGSKPHPELGYRACFGVLRLAGRFTQERLESACHRAVALNACSYRSIRSMLERGLDRQNAEAIKAPSIYSVIHGNVRGADYYQPKEVQ